MLARVVAVADAFDAMTSTRSYSRARPVPVALAELERCAGAQFDPEMVRALVDSIGRDGWRPKVTSEEDLQVIPAGAGAGAAAAAPGQGPGPAAVPDGDRAASVLAGLPAQAGRAGEPGAGPQPGRAGLGVDGGAAGAGGGGAGAQT